MSSFECWLTTVCVPIHSRTTTAQFTRIIDFERIIPSLSWRELIDKAGLALTLDISKPNVEHCRSNYPGILAVFANRARSQETEPAPTNVTDRPDVTESSIVVPKGSLQLENGITWTTDRSTRSVDLSETLVRFGISRRIELRLVIPNYFKDLTGSDASGFACQRIAPLQEVR